MAKMNAIFLIPARAGSKGIPGKNLRVVGGLPLLARAVRTTLRAARTLGLPSTNVLVSTDSPSMARVAQEWGADVPFLRPAELAGDSATSMDVVLHTLDFLRAQGSVPDRLILVAATNPLTEPDDILGALRLSMETGSSVVTVRPQEHPIEWAQRMSSDGRLFPAMSASGIHRRQDAPSAYRLTGAVYVAAPKQLIDRKTFIVEDTRGIETPAERAVDIDGPEDLALAESLLSARLARPIRIRDRLVGPGQPCLIVAEAGVNHNGSLEVARKLVDVAADAHADAVKFQTFRADRLVTSDAGKAVYQVKSTGHGSQFEMLRSLELPLPWHSELRDRCIGRKMQFLSTPFDETSANFLDDLGVPAFKLSSGDLSNLPLITHIARKKKPMIMSTGMATMREIGESVDAVRDAGNDQIILLQCVSQYPANAEEMNLRAMRTLALAFGTPVGLSDHTQGIEVAIGAAALGACLIEKHFTLDRGMPGPDHEASLTPNDLVALVHGIRTIEMALGDGIKTPSARELEMARAARRSLVAATHMPRGTLVTRAMIAIKRPGTGLAPTLLERVVGRRTVMDIKEDTILSWEMFEP